MILFKQQPVTVAWQRLHVQMMHAAQVAAMRVCITYCFINEKEITGCIGFNRL